MIEIMINLLCIFIGMIIGFFIALIIYRKCIYNVIYKLLVGIYNYNNRIYEDLKSDINKRSKNPKSEY